MKVKITDLMDLYEDKSCPLQPLGEDEIERGAHCAPLQAEGGALGEAYEVKQSKYPFGWRQVLSLAAALALLVLGGFGVKRLIDRSAAPVVPGGSGTDARIASTEQGDPSPIPLAGEEQKALSSFLSFFAMQQIQNYPEELSDDGALIHLAFLWRRNYDPESFTIREVRPVEGLTPEQAAPVEGLTPEQLNETLERLLGKTVTPPEDGADFDYSGQLGQPAGSTLFSAGCFWDNPTGKDASFFFALAEEVLPLPEPGRETVRFNVYYVNYERWGTIDMAAMSALSTAEAESLAAKEKLILTATGEAKLERTGDGYRLLSYVTEPAAQRPDGPNLAKVNALLTTFAEQGIDEYDGALAHETELFSFAHIYTKLHDPSAITYQNEEGISYETLTLEQVNETLTKLLGQTVSPRENTDYIDNGAKCASFRDGCFWWPAADGDTCTDFALLSEDGASLAGTGMEEVEFGLLAVVPEAWPDCDREALPELSMEAVEQLEFERKVRILTGGKAKIQWIDGEPILLSYKVSFMTIAVFVQDSVQSSRQEDPDGVLTAREIAFQSDGTFTYREGDQDSEFSYWCRGTWRGVRDGLRLDYTETDEDGQPLGEARWAVYTERFGNDGYFMTLCDGAGLGRDQLGWTVRYGVEPDEPEVPEDPALLAELEELFSDPQSWYSRALSSHYADPADVDLYLFFYDGLGDSKYASDEELQQFYNPDAFEDGRFMGPPVDRMDRAGMDKVLKQIFGLDLDRSSKRGLDRFHYSEETDAYYHCHGDTNAMEREISAARRMEDGTVLFTYEDGFWNDLTDGCYPALHTAALRPDGAGNYLVVSNLPGEWVTAEDLGELSALFPLSGVLRAETRDADGTVTVRELDFGMDGEFHYREGDPNSEFSHWTWGKWWIGEDRSFRCALCETSESGNRFSPWRSVSFRCTYQNGELVLTQQSETGFAEDAPGTELRFAPTAE